MSFNTTLLLLGVLLIVVGAVGQVKAKELEIGATNGTARVLFGILGAIFIALAFVFTEQSSVIFREILSRNIVEPISVESGMAPYQNDDSAPTPTSAPEEARAEGNQSSSETCTAECWHLILASLSHSEHSAAMRLRNNLSKKTGLELQVVNTDTCPNLANGLFIVTYAAKTRSAAYKYRDAVRIHIKDAYVKSCH